MLQKIVLVLFSLALFQSLQAGILRDRLGLGDEEDENEAMFSKEVQRIANVSYGNDQSLASALSHGRVTLRVSQALQRTMSVRFEMPPMCLLI